MQLQIGGKYRLRNGFSVTITAVHLNGYYDGSILTATGRPHQNTVDGIWRADGSWRLREPGNWDWNIISSMEIPIQDWLQSIGVPARLLEGLA